MCKEVMVAEERPRKELGENQEITPNRISHSTKQSFFKHSTNTSAPAQTTHHITLSKLLFVVRQSHSRMEVFHLHSTNAINILPEYYLRRGSHCILRYPFLEGDSYPSRLNSLPLTLHLEKQGDFARKGPVSNLTPRAPPS